MLYDKGMTRYIDCRQPLTGSEPPEHVIPQGFGTFERNLTLHCVGSECNGFFGRTFEWAMRNSSTEGVLRLQYGLGRGEIGNIGTDGIEFRIADSPDWKGAWCPRFASVFWALTWAEEYPRRCPGDS
jgi:hypothetical protein